MVVGILKKAVSVLKEAGARGLLFPRAQQDRELSALARIACEGRDSRSRFADSEGLVSRLYCRLAAPGRPAGAVNMKEVTMMNPNEPKKVLQTAIDKKITAIMSYLSKGKWHVAKVLPTDLGEQTLSVQSTYSQKKHYPINIQVGQPVGISFKYDYGKVVFDTTVLSLEPSSDADAGGTVVLALPERLEVIQRRSYFRVEAPSSLKVNVTIWHRSSKPGAHDRPQGNGNDSHRYRQGRLADISAGGAQVVLEGDCPADAPQFRKGQFIGMRFTPMPYETPLLLNAQIRNILPRADGNSIYLGLQIVGLEASHEGREVLARLVGVAERYYKMNQKPAKQASNSPATSDV